MAVVTHGGGEAVDDEEEQLGGSDDLEEIDIDSDDETPDRIASMEAKDYIPQESLTGWACNPVIETKTSYDKDVIKRITSTLYKDPLLPNDPLPVDVRKTYPRRGGLSVEKLIGKGNKPFVEWLGTRTKPNPGTQHMWTFAWKIRKRSEKLEALQ